jgi:type II secretory pathway component PulK
MRLKSNRKSGIALFLLLSFILIIAVLMKDFVLATSSQARRARNYTDRIQATYLARSTLNLARFFIMFDAIIDERINKDNPSDTLTDIWANPIPFPVPIEAILAAQSFAQEGVTAESADDEDEGSLSDDLKLKKCQKFFDDFSGSALSTIEDLSGRLNLNDLDEKTDATKDIFNTLLALLSPNVEFLQALNDRNLTPEELSRQIRDYMDTDTLENETKGPELTPYASAELDYGPKNRPFTNSDELKLIPSVDDELYDYLSPYVTAAYIKARKPPSKINLNTVGKNVFQALLKNVGNPEEIAEEFIKDREENARIYTDKKVAEMLKENLQLTGEEIRLGLVGGVSDSFLVSTEAGVGQISIKLTTIVPRVKNRKKINPLVQVRLSP